MVALEDKRITGIILGKNPTCCVMSLSLAMIHRGFLADYRWGAASTIQDYYTIIHVEGSDTPDCDAA